MQTKAMVTPKWAAVGGTSSSPSCCQMHLKYKLLPTTLNHTTAALCTCIQRCQEGNWAVKGQENTPEG